MYATFTEGSNKINGGVIGVTGCLRVVPIDIKIPETMNLEKLLDQLLLR